MDKGKLVMGSAAEVAGTPARQPWVSLQLRLGSSAAAHTLMSTHTLLPVVAEEQWLAHEVNAVNNDWWCV